MTRNLGNISYSKINKLVANLLSCLLSSDDIDFSKQKQPV